MLSALRDFSAPVKLEVAGQTDDDLVFLLAHDSDSFSRWEASQALQRGLLLQLYAAAKDDSKVPFPLRFRPSLVAHQRLCRFQSAENAAEVEEPSGF